MVRNPYVKGDWFCSYTFIGRNKENVEKYIKANQQAKEYVLKTNPDEIKDKHFPTKGPDSI